MTVPQQLTEITDKLNGVILFELIGWAALFLLILLEIGAAFGRRDLRRQLTEVNKDLDQTWDLLQIVKGWAESARVHSKEAVTAAKTVPMVETHVIDEVRKNPERTADMVVEKLKEDSDPFKKGLPPPGRP